MVCKQHLGNLGVGEREGLLHEQFRFAVNQDQIRKELANTQSQIQHVLHMRVEACEPKIW